ncbi:hypothetical protein Syun_031595 [Stephania yunnanensis]|uniref:NAC domain-containing protein n=1 Tax=Stephania yunnanensis TaxID=152371 RepID=A0AAP0HBK5_9MAGN
MAMCSVLGGLSSSEDVRLPCGYVFAPTDFELLHHFLLPKTLNPGIKFEEIHDLTNSIINYLPDNLTSLYERKRAKEWYFFSSITKKHKNSSSSRCDRRIVDESGYWRASNKQKDVQGLGNRRALNFFEEKNIKTDWIMQEYVLAPQHHSHEKFEDYALCKIYKRRDKANTSTKTNTTSTVQQVDHHQLDVGAQEEGMVNCMAPHLLSYSCGDHVNYDTVVLEEAAMVPTMNIRHAHDDQCINVEGMSTNEAAMVLPVLPYYSCGDVNEDQLVTMPGAAQEATTPMINNLQDQPLVPFMATNNAIADADMGVDSSGTTSCFDDHEDIDIESFLLNMDCDIDNEEFMAIIEAAYSNTDTAPNARADVETIDFAAADQPSSSPSSSSPTAIIDCDIDNEEFMAIIEAARNNPDTAPDAGAEVETIEVAAADQPSSSATTAISSMDTDIMMRDEQNDIFAELQLFSPLTYHFNEWPDDDYTPDFSQDHAYDLCLETC